MKNRNKKNEKGVIRLKLAYDSLAIDEDGEEKDRQELSSKRE